MLEKKQQKPNIQAARIRKCSHKMVIEVLNNSRLFVRCWINYCSSSCRSSFPHSGLLAVFHWAHSINRAGTNYLLRVLYQQPIILPFCRSSCPMFTNAFILHIHSEEWAVSSINISGLVSRFVSGWKQPADEWIEDRGKATDVGWSHCCSSLSALV